MFRALLLLTLLSAALPAPAQEPAQGPPRGEERVFVLVVGVKDYADPKITDLSYTEDDAQAVYDFFAKDPRSPTSAARVTLLRGAKATRVAILRAVRDQLIRRATGPQDTAILYFAGHGFTDADGVYLATQDTRLDDLQYTAITWSELQRQWSKIGAGRRVFMADACHSGGLAGLRGFGGIRRDTFQERSPKRASVLIAATGANQLSVEDKRSKHGVFTAGLLSGLRGAADADRDGAVSLGELAGYLEREVPQLAKRAGGNQLPTVSYSGGEAFARSLALSQGRAQPVPTLGSQLARMQAERKAAERERERAELQARLADARLEKLKDASAAERQAAEAQAARAQAALAKASQVAQRLRTEELKRVEAEKRAADAEAENAKLRLKLAELEGKTQEADAARKAEEEARARAARLERFKQLATPIPGALGVISRALSTARNNKVLRARLLDRQGFQSKDGKMRMVLSGKLEPRGLVLRMEQWVTPKGEGAVAKSYVCSYRFNLAFVLEEIRTETEGEITVGRIREGVCRVKRRKEGRKPRERQYAWPQEACPHGLAIMLLTALGDQGVPARVAGSSYPEHRLGSSRPASGDALVFEAQGALSGGLRSYTVREGKDSAITVRTYAQGLRKGQIHSLQTEAFELTRMTALQMAATGVSPVATGVIKGHLRTIKQALDMYRLKRGALPRSLEDLLKEGVVQELPQDPWGRPYVYRRLLGKRPYSLLSLGADGKPGGEGANADLHDSALLAD